MRVLTAALLTMHAVLGWRMRPPGLGTGNDDAWYIALARAVRQGGYVELPIVGTPAHAMYPPLYPALLAALGVTGPERIDIAMVASLALSVAALAFTAAVAARDSQWLALAILLVGAFNPMLLHTASRVGSEPMLAATAAAAIATSLRHRRGARATALVGLLAIAAALSRSIGVSLVLATLALFAWERNWRAVAALAVAATLTVGAWLTWTVKAPRLAAGRSYVADALYVPTTPSGTIDGSAPGRDTVAAGGAAAAGPVADRTADRPGGASPRQLAEAIGRRVAHNVPAYLTRELPTVLAVPTMAGTTVDNVAWLVILLVTGIAGIGVLARRSGLLVLYLTFTAAVLLVWPYAIQRFLAPVVPMLLLVVLAGGWWLGERLGGVRGARVATGALTFVMTLGAIRRDVAQLARSADCDRRLAARSPGCFSSEQRDFFDAVAAAARVSSDSARFLVSKEATFYLLSGRQAVREIDALAHADPRSFREFLVRERVDFIILSRLHVDQWALAAPLGAQCEALELVQSFGAHVALLRVTPRTAARAPLRAAGADPDAAPRREACSAIDRWSTGDWDDAATIP
jgi:hypothetical protein